MDPEAAQEKEADRNILPVVVADIVAVVVAVGTQLGSELEVVVQLERSGKVERAMKQLR